MKEKGIARELKEIRKGMQDMAKLLSMLVSHFFNNLEESEGNLELQNPEDRFRGYLG